MSYITWTVVTVLALVALVVFLFMPGLAIVAAIALGVAVVFGILLLIGRGAAGAGDMTPDNIERRDEHRARRANRRAR